MKWELEFEEFFFAGCMHNCQAGVEVATGVSKEE